MKFQVPQFIETETKLIGPMTLKQFLFVAGGISMSAVEILALSGMIRMVVVFVTLGFFGSLAFLKIDGQPFLNYLAYMLGYALGTKRYIFQPKIDTEIKPKP